MALPHSYVLVLSVMLMLLPGCYHMRLLAEPIQPEMSSVALKPQETLRRVKKALASKQHLRILEAEQDETILITAPWHFATDTGLGQPPGGRKYYVQLRIEVFQRDGQTTVSVAPYHYEIRTSYAYVLDGQVRTLYKIYPYEEYPGMFDLEPLKRELAGVTRLIKLVCHE